MRFTAGRGDDLNNLNYFQVPGRPGPGLSNLPGGEVRPTSHRGGQRAFIDLERAASDDGQNQKSGSCYRHCL